jgi:hypothetical protein
MTSFQYRDPVTGILDYIVEVRLPGHDDSSRLMYEYLGGPKKEVPRGHHSHCP